MGLLLSRIRRSYVTDVGWRIDRGGPRFAAIRVHVTSGNQLLSRRDPQDRGHRRPGRFGISGRDVEHRQPLHSVYFRRPARVALWVVTVVNPRVPWRKDRLERVLRCVQGHRVSDIGRRQSDDRAPTASVEAFFDIVSVMPPEVMIPKLGAAASVVPAALGVGFAHSRIGHRCDCRNRGCD